MDDHLTPLSSVGLNGRKIVARTTFLSRESIYPNVQPKKDVDSVEERLAEQFRYFKREFIESATSAGVTVPLDIVEDTTGRVFNFVKHQGPKYVLQIMQSNFENTHLLRSALSLLIVTVNILRRNLPESEGGIKPMGWMVSMADTITNWATSSLNQFAEAGVVTACIGLIVTSHINSIQELAFSLLSLVTSVSKEAASHMFQVPSSFGNETEMANTSQSMGLKRRIMSTANTENDGKPKASPKSLHHASFISSTQLFKRPSTSPARPSSKPSTSPKEQTEDNHLEMLLKVHGNEPVDDTDEGKKVPLPGSCLSMMLTIAAMHRNRHLVTASCADIVLAMCMLRGERLCETIAKTPTCQLNSNGQCNLVSATRNSTNTVRSSNNNANNMNPNSNNNNSNNASNNCQSSNGVSNGMTMNNSSNNNNCNNNNNNNKGVVEWAGIKIFMKFLSRFLHFNELDPSSYSTTQERDELLFAFSKVFVLVIELIISSPVILNFVYHWEGAEEIVRASISRVKNPSVTLQAKIDHCISLFDNAAIHEELASHSSHRSNTSPLRNSTKSLLRRPQMVSSPIAKSTTVKISRKKANFQPPGPEIMRDKNRPGVASSLPSIFPSPGLGRPTTAPMSLSTNTNSHTLNISNAKAGHHLFLRPNSTAAAVSSSLDRSSSRPPSRAKTPSYLLQAPSGPSFHLAMQSLPSTPSLPARIDQHDVLNASVDQLYYSLDTREMSADGASNTMTSVSSLRSGMAMTEHSVDNISVKVVDQLKRAGAISNGKLYMPREERYRRIYNPKECPIKFKTAVKQQQHQQQQQQQQLGFSPPHKRIRCPQNDLSADERDPYYAEYDNADHDRLTGFRVEDIGMDDNLGLGEFRPIYESSPAKNVNILTFGDENLPEHYEEEDSASSIPFANLSDNNNQEDTLHSSSIENDSSFMEFMTQNGKFQQLESSNYLFP